jgi:hypothetical protein
MVAGQPHLQTTLMAQLEHAYCTGKRDKTVLYYPKNHEMRYVVSVEATPRDSMHRCSDASWHAQSLHDNIRSTDQLDDIVADFNRCRSSCSH